MTTKFKILIIIFISIILIYSQDNISKSEAINKSLNEYLKGNHCLAINILDSLYKIYTYDCIIIDNLLYFNYDYYRRSDNWDLNKLIKYCNKILDKCKNDTIAMNHALVIGGEAYLRKGNKDKAYEFYRKAIELDESNNYDIVSFVRGYYNIIKNKQVPFDELKFWYEIDKSNSDLNRELSTRYWGRHRYIKSIYHSIKFFYIRKILGK